MQTCLHWRLNSHRCFFSKQYRHGLFEIIKAYFNATSLNSLASSPPPLGVNTLISLHTLYVGAIISISDVPQFHNLFMSPLAYPNSISYRSICRVTHLVNVTYPGIGCLRFAYAKRRRRARMRERGREWRTARSLIAHIICRIWRWKICLELGDVIDLCFFFCECEWKFLFSSDSEYKLELRSFCDSWVNLPRVFPIKTKMKVSPKDAVLNEYTALVKWRPIIHRRTATPFGFHVVAIRDDGSARNPQLNPNVICSGF